jgi:hypothetical protein
VRARVVAFLLIVVAAAAGVLSAPATADAHPLSTTAILLDIESEQVTGQVQLPIDRLAIALNQPLTTTVVDQPAGLEVLRQYVAAHISAADTASAAPWVVDVADPLEPVSATLVAHPLLAAAVLGGLAATAWTVQRRRAPAAAP